VGAVEFLLLLPGPVGARKAAGPLGGDLGAGRVGDRSRGVEIAESRPLFGI